jgi:hypothetical protein
MAGGNRAVIVYMPPELRSLVAGYQSDRRKQSFSAALVELIETHPEIAKQAAKVYAQAKDLQTPRPLEA